jgi:hypothetical protein
MESGLIIILFIFTAVVIRLLAGSFDGERVEQYIRDKGGELIEKSWDPFGPGFLGEEDSRIYQIVYRDKNGRIHRAHVKTSMFSGVYLTNDEIIEDRPPLSVEVEKAELRKRLAELEQREPAPSENASRPTG